MNTRPGMEQPVHFGTDALFGMYHPASAARAAVLLCHPFGQEQIRCHRLYRQLAQALAGEGLAVLRFDYHGTGDSPGDSSEVDWRRCIEDTVDAAAELRRLSGCANVAAFGARLGGSLVLAVAERARFMRVIAWDAVLDGAAYVTRLDARQEQLRQDTDRFPKPRSREDAAGQWLGFAASPSLRAQLSALRVALPDVPTLLLQSATTTDCAGHARMLAAGARSAMLSTPPPWDDPDRLETTVLSPEAIHAVRTSLRDAA